MAKQSSLFSSKVPKSRSEEQKEDSSPILITAKSDEFPAALSPPSPPVAAPSEQRGKYAKAKANATANATAKANVGVRLSARLLGKRSLGRR